MTITAKLLRVYQVENQIRGLQTRLRAAEKFLTEQTRDLGSLEARRGGLDAQLRQQQAVAAEREGEMKRLDAKMGAIREHMNNAQTNKEYKAFLTELNTFKIERDKAETAALEAMTKVEELRTQIDGLAKQREEREAVRKVATGDRDKRHEEIATRLAELQSQRAAFVADVPPDLLKAFQRLMETRGEEAMGAVEVQDARRHEYTCGACMMTVPVEKVSRLLSSGDMTTCVSCQCVLYLNDAAIQVLQPPAKGSKKEKQSAT